MGYVNITNNADDYVFIISGTLEMQETLDLVKIVEDQIYMSYQKMHLVLTRYKLLKSHAT